jgi:hypothetical protein
MTAGSSTGLIDCYVDDLGTGAYGVTYSDGAVAGGHPNDYKAYFVIDNDYVGFGYPSPIPPMQVTVAHEYNHVVQMGLNVGTAWWMENTSTYCEDEVYDSINDNYLYLSAYFSSPWKRLATFNGGFEYAAFIWPTYLDEGLGGHGLVRDIWIAYADNTNLYNCFDLNLAPFSGKNLDTAVAEWSRWNIYTWLHDDGAHYVEGAAYRAYVYVGTDQLISTYPVANIHPAVARRPQDLGANYTRFVRQSGSTDNKITITYQVLNSCSYSHVIQFARKIVGQSLFHEWEVPVDATGAATFEMTDWDQTEYLYRGVPMKRGCSSAGVDFQFRLTTYTVGVEDLPVGRTVRCDQSSPNPFSPSTAIGRLRDEGSVRVRLRAMGAGSKPGRA